MTHLHESLGDLYTTPIKATRIGPLYNAFPYPTKISPETIALFIASHTRPGDTVYDGFAGCGTTGLGAILCSHPPSSLQSYAESLKLPVHWGPRRAVLFEIGVLGSLVAQVLCSPPDHVEFVEAAEQVMRKVEERYGWLYEAIDPEGQPGTVRYIVWSDILKCCNCRKQVAFWDACVSREPANISGVFRCSKCGNESLLESNKRVMETQYDDLLGAKRETRRRRMVWVYGSTNGQNWMRQKEPSDSKLFQRICNEPIPSEVPNVAIPWGDLYRRGYHEGITHLHHFYTRRNLIVFAALWSEAEKQPTRIKNALLFWLLSYNASHSTIMTRVVAKKGSKDLVVTSAQPGVLYVSGLPVEKNVLLGLQRKMRTIAEAFRITHKGHGLVEVHNASCLSTELLDESVDYVFTDPPFGGNIPYSEVNFLNEAWLGETTDQTDEVIVSPHQGKTIDDYQSLMLESFHETYRILKKDGRVTVVFHSSSAKVWNALLNALNEAGFSIEQSSVLEKTQASFKQVTTKSHVRGDPLILLTKEQSKVRTEDRELQKVIDTLRKQAQESSDPEEITPQRLYSRLVSHYLSRQQEIPIDARAFYTFLEKGK